MNTKLVVLALAAATLVNFSGGSAAAHTDSDVIAVPAGEKATVRLKPTHGCGGSPTTGVAIQAPVAGATAGEVVGWTASASDDGAGHTVLEWKGGSLPADQTGAFPVTFAAPNTPGKLLTFPSVQYCENGEELSWISGDPEAEFPAPRLLILAAGSEVAGELAEIPADAPGRDQLTAIVDVDNPRATTTNTAPTTTSTTTAPSAPSTPTATAETGSVSPTPVPAENDDEDSTNTPLIIGGIVLLIVVGAGGAYALRRRSSTP
ncbi:MAG: DUF1775 domain-containing protein [Aquihabitans sp.]